MDLNPLPFAVSLTIYIENVNLVSQIRFRLIAELVKQFPCLVIVGSNLEP